MTKILVIGGGFPQLCLIEAARRRDYHITVADNRLDCPGAALADVSLSVYRYDLNAIKKATNHLFFDVVTSGGADKSVWIASRLARIRSLPFYITNATAAFPMQKGAVRRQLERWNLPCPRARNIVSENELESRTEGLRFPLVVKPDDGIGQTAVNRVDTMESLSLAVREALAAAKCKRAIVEEFVTGDELGINGFIDHSGQFHLLSVGTRYASKEPGTDFGVALMKDTPSAVTTSDRKNLTELFQSLSSRLNLTNTPIYAQVIRLTYGGFVIVEVMPRLGGGEDPRLVEFVTGFQISEAVLDACHGREINITCYQKEPLATLARAIFLTASPGTVTEIQGYPIKSPQILYQRMYIDIGATVHSIRSSRDRLGVVVIGGENMHQIATKTEEILAGIHIYTA